MDFRERKAERADYYRRYVAGWKLRPCYACNGSGRYDSNGSPPCGGCDGTGKERYKPEAPKTPNVGAKRGGAVLRDDSA